MPEELTEKEKKFLARARKWNLEKPLFMYLMLGALVIMLISCIIIGIMKINNLPEPKTSFDMAYNGLYERLWVNLISMTYMLGAFAIGFFRLTRTYLRIINKLQKYENG